jgi:hypothetical protein
VVNDPAARRVYFDTQQWNYFVGPDTGPHPEGALRRVLKARKAGDIEVVGSLDLLQELMEAVPRAEKKSRRMMDLFFKLVGDRLLLPLDERQRAEALAPGLLSVEERYLTQGVRRDLRRLAQSGGDVFEVADDLHREKVGFRESEAAVQAQMTERLAEGGIAKQARLMRDWITKVDIDEWVHEIATAGRAKGLTPDDASVRPDQLPSVRAFVAGRLARLARTMGEGRKIQDSDLADAHHIACSPYIDVLVTDDNELRATIELVRDRVTLDALSSAEFFATLP